MKWEIRKNKKLNLKIIIIHHCLKRCDIFFFFFSFKLRHRFKKIPLFLNGVGLIIKHWGHLHKVGTRLTAEADSGLLFLCRKLKINKQKHTWKTKEETERENCGRRRKTQTDGLFRQHVDQPTLPPLLPPHVHTSGTKQMSRVFLFVWTEWSC